VCETGAGVLERSGGQMSFEHFSRLIDRVHRRTNAIQLYFMGEPFLNKRTYDMVRYAKERGIYVNTYSHGGFFDAARIVESGLDEININIGGMTQATHETYRVNSDLGRTIANIRALVAERARWVAAGSGRRARPLIAIGFIVMKHNEHEVDEFLAVAPTWGVDRVHVVDPCVRDMGQARSLLPTDLKYWFYDEHAFEKGVLKPKAPAANSCPWIYYSSVITWNGNVVPCCRDARGKHVMGNVFREDFDQIWNGPAYRDFREKIATNQKDIDICRLCSSFPIPALYQIEAGARPKS
jgi:radical SAM protein with 4Fe4S-binding SPASM domain